MATYSFENIALITYFALIALSVHSSAKEMECEVCQKFLTRFQNEGIPSEDSTSSPKIIQHFKTFCKKARGKDERFCYYVGGLETSATFIVKVISDPMANGLPIEKVCQKLMKSDPQICDLKYEKKADLKSANFQKMRVKQLKRILEDWGEACVGCTEKSEYIKLIEQKMSVHDPEAYAVRSKAKKTEL